jgi:beta-glucanase (GH16 family)
MQTRILIILLVYASSNLLLAQVDPYKPEKQTAKHVKGMKLVWHEEFNEEGKPDTSVWKFEKGFVRNNELQWYQSENANCSHGVLVIEGRREKVANPDYTPRDASWKKNREFAEYSSSSMHTRGKKQFQFGRFEIRARINTSKGSWPAIWTLGIDKPWPSCGEIDLLEYYISKDVPSILANMAWGTSEKWVGKWNSKKTPLNIFTAKDADWVNKFHTWRMDWDKDKIELYLDDELLNSCKLSETINADGSNPFLQPHYILLNLAIGSNGGDPSSTVFPIKYEVDYVRVYQSKAK